jgi:malate dehydrogenase
MMQPALRGVVMELQDCAFPLLKEIIATDAQSTVFTDIDYAFLVGSKPRGPGMERGDLLKQNGEIFVKVGEDLNQYAKKTCRVITVGNPANTNCLIAQSHAPSIPKQNFSAMTRLDHNRAISQLAIKTNTPVTGISNLAIWGNHSSTMFPDASHAKVNGRAGHEALTQDWISSEFIPTVQQRGAAIIAARKLSSAASAANAAIDHMKDWTFGTNGGWVSMAVPSELYQGAYGIPDGLIFSYPVTVDAHGSYHLVRDLPINNFAQEKLRLTIEELQSEKQAVQQLLRK